MSTPVDMEREVSVPWAEVTAQLRPYVARRVPACDVDDVIQDVLLRMHRGLPGLNDELRFTGWMFQIARSSIGDRGRMRSRHPIAIEATEPAAALGDRNDERNDERNATAVLAGCLSVFVARLASPYREAITRVELEGRPIREAAALAEVSVSGMKSRVQRGRAQLRALLESCCEIALDARGAITEVSPRPHAGCRC